MQNKTLVLKRLAAFSLVTVVLMIWLTNAISVYALLPVASQKGISTAEKHVFVGDANNPRSYCNTGTPSTDDKVFPSQEQRGSTDRCK
jgi:hypothetical protein